VAGRGRPKSSLILTREERNTLQHWARRRTIGALALRSRMVLASADGDGNNEIAEQFGVSPQTAGKWRARFIRRRLDGLADEPRAGAPRKVTDQVADRMVARTLRDSPPTGTRWSTRSMAQATGLSQSTVARIWSAHGIRAARRHQGRVPVIDLVAPIVRLSRKREGYGLKPRAGPSSI
jgi:transposase